MQKLRPVIIVIIASVAFWKGFRDADSKDPARTTPSYEGRTEIELRAGAGAPVRERHIDGTNKEEACVRRGGGQVERELTYSVPSRGLGKQIRDFFGLPPATSFVACVDRSGRITTVSQVEY